MRKKCGSDALAHHSSLITALIPTLAHNAFEADETVALIETNQPHALSVAALNGNVADRRSDQRAARADQHHFVFGHNSKCTHHATVSIRRLQCNHTLPTPAVPREFGNG